MFKMYITLLSLIFVCALNAQQGVSPTGIFSNDASVLPLLPSPGKAAVLPALPEDDKKSPLLAGLMSLILPGSGQLYTGHYWEAGIFLGIEAAAVTTGIIYDKKGDKLTVEFEQFADEHWSAVKYAKWLNANKGYSIDIDELTAGLAPWQRVNWDSLNFYESSFSHRLPKHPAQQYYELIGKYPQYSPGWNSAPGLQGFDENDTDYHNIPPIFTHYASLRGKANDYYNVATKAVVVIYINHFLSALDAVWGAVSYNRALSVSMQLRQSPQVPVADYSPTLRLRYTF